MRQLTMADLVPNREYELLRPDSRRRIIQLKKMRRILIGPRISLVFENTETVTFQVQEMMRIEHIEDPEKIQDEILVYNDLLPPGMAFGATLLIELTQSDNMPEVLRQLSGVEEHVRLLVGKRTIMAMAEPGRSTEEKTSSVHYLTFTFTPDDRTALMDHLDQVSLAIDHPGYSYTVAVPPETAMLLARDLTLAE